MKVLKKAEMTINIKIVVTSSDTHIWNKELICSVPSAVDSIARTLVAIGLEYSCSGAVFTVAYHF